MDWSSAVATAVAENNNAAHISEWLLHYGHHHYYYKYYPRLLFNLPIILYKKTQG